MDGRIDVAEIPFVGRDLPVGVHVPFAQKQNQLVLGKFGIHVPQRNHVKCGIPRGVPGILPLVRHRNDVAVVQVRPVAVANLFSVRRRRRHVGIALQPVIHRIIVKLFGPQQAGICLTHGLLCIFGQILWQFVCVEGVGFRFSLLQGEVEWCSEHLCRRFVFCPQP